MRIGWVNLRSWVAAGRARNLARNSSAIADRRSSESESGSWLSLKLIAYQVECILSTGFGPFVSTFWPSLSRILSLLICGFVASLNGVFSHSAQLDAGVDLSRTAGTGTGTGTEIEVMGIATL